MEERLNDELVGQLIDRELENSKRGGMDLFLRISSPYMGEEELEQRLKAVKGYRVWWTTDSDATFSRLAQVNYIKKLNEGLYEVSACCILERSSAHHMYEEGEPPDEHVATVTIKVTDTLEVKDFDFRWGD